MAKSKLTEYILNQMINGFRQTTDREKSYLARKGQAEPSQASLLRDLEGEMEGLSREEAFLVALNGARNLLPDVRREDFDLIFNKPFWNMICLSHNSSDKLKQHISEDVSSTILSFIHSEESPQSSINSLQGDLAKRVVMSIEEYKDAESYKNNLCALHNYINNHDYAQELMNAAKATVLQQKDLFQPEKNSSFWGFAEKAIKGSMQAVIRDDSLVCFPDETRKAQKHVRTAVRSLEEQGTDITDSSILCAYLEDPEVSEKRVMLERKIQDIEEQIAAIENAHIKPANFKKEVKKLTESVYRLVHKLRTLSPTLERIRELREMRESSAPQLVERESEEYDIYEVGETTSRYVVQGPDPANIAENEQIKRWLRHRFSEHFDKEEREQKEKGKVSDRLICERLFFSDGEYGQSQIAKEFELSPATISGKKKMFENLAHSFFAEMLQKHEENLNKGGSDNG